MGDREDAYRQLFKQNTGEYNKIVKMKEKQDTMLERSKELKDMPNQYWHRIISFVKSGVRLTGYAFIPFDLLVATLILIISEIIGIVEELV
jgi:hypothetical protein